MVVAVMAVYALLSRSPAIVGELVDSWRQGRESQAARDRRERLLKAGVDPATGGAARQFAANLWRDTWLDLDEARSARRAARKAGRNGSSRGGWAARVDAAVGERLRRWGRDTSFRRSPGCPGGGDSRSPGTGTVGGRVSPKSPRGGGTQPPGSPRGGTAGDRVSSRSPGAGRPRDWVPVGSPEHGTPWNRYQCAESVVHDSDEYVVRDSVPDGQDSEDTPGTGCPEDEDSNRPPLRVDVTVGKPMRQENTMTQAVEVSGIGSAHAEAEAILRAAKLAAIEYSTALGALRDRLQSLAEQTVGQVQMATTSRVVGYTQTAGEAAAAAQAHAVASVEEIIECVDAVKREFGQLLNN